VLFGMYGTAPDLITIDLANALLFTAFAVTWTGARVFDGRPVEPVYLVTGAVLWLLVCRLPVLADAVDARALIASGIANHRAFLQDAALLAKRHSGNPRPTAVLLIDLDHFKSINDRFRHALGDRVLEIFTDAARQSIRSSDLIGRLGGEEFAAVLYDTSRDKAVAERIRESFAQVAQDVDGRPVCASVSIGIVHC
jgi:diguanylate cyclase (GGDEF)-like protein